MFVDALSRHPVSAVAPARSDPVQRFPSDGELRKLQDHDPLLGPAIGVHLQKFPSPVPSAVANIVANTVMCHNVLCHETSHGPAAVVPQAIRQLLLYYTHDLAGHFSHPYVMDKLRGWYWPQMSAEVLKYCNSCDVCSQANASRPSTRMPLQEFPPATRMGDRLHIDLLSMPRSASGKIGICTAVDAATGFIFATAIENKTKSPFSVI